jgi:hypothetical protein
MLYEGQGFVNSFRDPCSSTNLRKVSMIIIGEDDVLPEHISYSALNDFIACGWMYYLNRIKNVKEVPAWWLYGGVAVHEATEAYDKKGYVEPS